MKNKIDIDIELEENGKIFYLHQSTKGLSLYETIKVIDKFKDKETSVLEKLIDMEIKTIMYDNGVFIKESKNEDIIRHSLNELTKKGIKIEIIDRYEKYTENVVGLSKNLMTIVMEDDGTLSSAVEVRVLKI